MQISSVENDQQKLSVSDLLHSKPLIIAVLVMAAAIYFLRLDQAIGLMLDDAWYVLLAKSLASGQGYQVINSPTPGMHPLYPPGFPAVLSLVFRIAPNFPQNLYVLKSVSILAMLGLSWLIYRYYLIDRHESKWMAGTLALLAFISPPLVVLATSTVMSECVFTFWLVVTVVTVERSAKQENNQKMLLWGSVAGLCAAAAFLTRTMAVGLIGAGVLYFLFRKKMPALVGFVLAVLLVCLPWQLYSMRHKPTEAHIQEQAGHIVRGYQLQFWDKVAGYPSLGSIDASDLPERVWNNLSEILGMNAGSIMANPLFPGLNNGEGERWGGFPTAISFFLSALIIWGYVVTCKRQFTFAEIAVPFSSLVPLVWGFPQFRYFVPLTPFLYYYLLAGGRAIAGWHQRFTANPQERQPRAEPSGQWVLIIALLLSLTSHAYYLYLKLGSPASEAPGWIRNFNEHADLINWTKENIPPNNVVVTHNPALVYLLTGLKSVTFDDPATRWKTWDNLGVRYYVRTTAMPLPERDPAERRYNVMYRANGRLKMRVVDLGNPGSRPVWGTP